ncbi:hypothetical protein [Rhizobium sp. Root1220]|uniref:hypothetical protein n=1 Tax=Rhizobium sp. Root1220 TaxID=1736432 RepID=UPI000AAC4481|nr:hypothetical protein [Rhizobium sp. Root1220]
MNDLVRITVDDDMMEILPPDQKPCGVGEAACDCCGRRAVMDEDCCGICDECLSP